MKRLKSGLIVGLLLLSGCTPQKADREKKIAVNQETKGTSIESAEEKTDNRGLTITVESSKNKEVNEFVYYEKEDGLYELDLQNLVEKKVDPLSKNGGDFGQVVDEMLVYEHANGDIIQYGSKDKVVLESNADLLKVLTDKQSHKHYLYYMKNEERFIKEMEQGAQAYEVGNEVGELVIYGGRRYYTATNEAMWGELGYLDSRADVRYEDIVPMTYIYTSQLSGDAQEVLIDPTDYKESVAGKWEERQFGYLDMTLADVEAGRIYFSITIEDGDGSISTYEEQGGAYIADLEGKNGEYKGIILRAHRPFNEEDYSGFYSNRRYFAIGLNVSKKNPAVVIEGIIFSQEGDWVYYSHLDEQKVAKTNLVTGETKELFTAPMSYHVWEVVKVGDWIYYTEDVAQDYMNFTLCAWNELTGEKREEPLDEESARSYMTTSYYESLSGERIYLDNGCIYQFNVETGEETVLKDQVGYELKYMKVTE